MAAYITPIISGIFAVIICVIEVRTTRERKRTEARAAVRAEESRLSMKQANANTKLALVTAKAVTHQHINGDVEDAIKSAEEAQKDYEDFLVKITSQHTTKI